MKARYSPFTSKERKLMMDTIDKESSRFIEEKRMYITVKTLAQMCLALNEQYGFGRQRLCKLIYQTGEEALRQDYWEDIGVYMLVKRLRHIEMDELADALEQAEKDILEHREESNDV